MLKTIFILLILSLESLLAQSYEQLKPFFDQNCVTCHNKKHKPDFSTFHSLISSRSSTKIPLIIPTKPEKSQFVLHLKTKAYPKCSENITETEIQTIENWILNGTVQKLPVIFAQSCNVDLPENFGRKYGFQLLQNATITVEVRNSQLKTLSSYTKEFEEGIHVIDIELPKNTEGRFALKLIAVNKDGIIETMSSALLIKALP